MIGDRIARQSEAMGLTLDEKALKRFEKYYEMLLAGNEKMNLTTVLDPDEAVDRHFMDCLAPVKLGLLPENAKLVDIGTGAGFPGLPLLIARPDLKVTLVDALNKRLGFIREVLDALELDAKLVHLRAEDFSHKPEYREQFDVAAARAVAGLSPLMEYLLPSVRRGGFALCWKGPGVEQEIAEARKAIFLLGGKAREPVGYEIPGRDWAHNLLAVDKVSGTPKTYPRKAGTPSRNPL